MIDRHWPALASRYRAAYRDAMDAPEQYQDALRNRFGRIAAEVGIPLSAERNGNARPTVRQMELWETRETGNVATARRRTVIRTGAGRR